MLSKQLRYLRLTPISAIAIAPALGAQSAKPEKIALEGLLVVEPLGAPVVLPDGTQFAMIRNEPIVLMPSDGGYYKNNSTET